MGQDLYTTEAAVEEFALQSLAQSAGLRFAQLGDMGERDGLNNGVAATSERVSPLTKVERTTVALEQLVGSSPTGSGDSPTP